MSLSIRDMFCTIISVFVVVVVGFLFFSCNFILVINGKGKRSLQHDRND